jgi:aspartate racemase
MSKQSFVNRVAQNLRASTSVGHNASLVQAHRMFPMHPRGNHILGAQPFNPIAARKPGSILQGVRSQGHNTSAFHFSTHAHADVADKKARPLNIGIIGGMGSEAASNFFQSFVKVQQYLGVNVDGDFIVTLYSNDPTIPDRTNFLLGKGQSPIPALQKHMDRFKVEMDMAGAICNTVHAPQIMGKLQQANPDMPILHLIKATELFIAKNYKGKKIGLLATDGTIKTNLYNNATKIIPDEAYQRKVMMAIYAVKAGYIDDDCVQSPEQRKQLLKILQKHPNTADYAASLTPEDMKLPKKWFLEAVDHLKQKGAAVVIMGCTEIPLVLGPDHTPVTLVDTIKVLALAFATTARDPDIIQYFAKHKGKETWNHEEVQKEMAAAMERSLDLSTANDRLSEFLGYTKPPIEKMFAKFRAQFLEFDNYQSLIRGWADSTKPGQAR